METDCTLKQKISTWIADRQVQQQGGEATTYYSGFMVGEPGWCKVWCGCLGRAEDAENVKGTAVSAGYLDGCGVETRRVL
jgi:hypothetical protein